MIVVILFCSEGSHLFTDTRWVVPHSPCPYDAYCLVDEAAIKQVNRIKNVELHCGKCSEGEGQGTRKIKNVGT